MKNYQRLMALTLVTSITMTSIASTRAWADIRLEDRSGTVQVPVKRVETVMVPQQRVVMDVQSRQVRSTDIFRDDSNDLTCRAYAGMDHQELQAKYEDLRFKHAENWVQKPESGSIITGAVAGAALTVVTGGLALVGAAIGGLFGGLFSWFKGGKTDEERDLAKRARDAKFDEETLQLNCMENELKKSQIYAGTIPGQMPAAVNYSTGTKPIASNSSSGSSSGQPSVQTGNGNADGTSTSTSCGGSGGCSGQFYDRDGSTDGSYVFTDSPHYPAPELAPVEDHSSRAVANCFR